MKKKKDIKTLTMGEIFSKIFFAMILAFLPLYMDEKFYTAMIAAKGHSYWMIAGVTGIGVLITLISAVMRKEPVLRFQKEKVNALDWAFIAYVAVVMIAFVLSDNKKDVFWGSGGFYVGTFTVITLTIFYFFVSRNLRGSKKMWDMIIILNCFIFLWIVLNTISVDILGMHAKIKESQRLAYFASLGQMDSVSAYLCLLLPIIIVFILNEKRTHFWQYACLLTGLMALTGIQTDGVYIGITMCAIFLIPYALKEQLRLKNLLKIGVLWGLAITFYSICLQVIPERIGKDMGISGTLIKYWAGLIMIVICGGLLFWIEKKRILVSDKVLHILSIIAFGVLLLVLAAFILHGIVSLAGRDIGWGNGRGGIWLGSLDMFKEYNLVEKLFGLGTTGIREKLTHYATSLNGWQGVRVANAHNDFLEQLLTTGLVGLVAYTATWVIPIVQYVKQKKTEKEWSVTKVAYFMSLMAYLGQSIVGNPYSLSVPIMFLMFMLYRNEDFL